MRTTSSVTAATVPLTPSGTSATFAGCDRAVTRMSSGRRRCAALRRSPLHLDAAQALERQAVVDNVGALDDLQRPVAGPGAGATAGHHHPLTDVCEGGKSHGAAF